MMKERKVLLGYRLRCARQRTKLLQGDVADMLQVSRQSVSAWESGTTSPTAIQLAELATLYCESAHALLFGVQFTPVDVKAMGAAKVRP